MRILPRLLAMPASLMLAVSEPVNPQQHGELEGLPPVKMSFDARGEPELEVMRARTGHLLVRPALNGVEGGWFIFDTGAAICVISTPVVDSFELTALGEMQAEGTGGSSTTQAVMCELFELGPMVLQDVPMMSTDLSFLRQQLGVEIAGVVGYGLLSRCVFEVDLLAPRIALHDPATYELTAGAWTPLELDHLIPTVSATYEGRPGRFQLDIGSSVPLIFQEPTVRRFKLLEGRALTDSQLGGVGGFIAAKSGRLASFELAGVRFDGLQATFPLEAKGVTAEEGRDGSIGAKPLEAFFLTFDYPGQRICFRPRGGG